MTTSRAAPREALEGDAASHVPELVAAVACICGRCAPRSNGASASSEVSGCGIGGGFTDERALLIVFIAVSSGTSELAFGVFAPLFTRGGAGIAAVSCSTLLLQGKQAGMWYKRTPRQCRPPTFKKAIAVFCSC